MERKLVNWSKLDFLSTKLNPIGPIPHDTSDKQSLFLRRFHPPYGCKIGCLVGTESGLKGNSWLLMIDPSYLVVDKPIWINGQSSINTGAHNSFQSLKPPPG